MKTLQIFPLLAVIQNVFTQDSKSNYGMFQTDRHQPRGQVSNTVKYPDAIAGHNGQNDEYNQTQAANSVMARLGDNHNLKTAIKDRIADVEFVKSQGQEHENASGMGYEEHFNFTKQSQYSGQGTDFGQVRADALYSNVKAPRGMVDTKYFRAEQGSPGQSGDYNSSRSLGYESGHNAGAQQKQLLSPESHENQTRGIGYTGYPYANNGQNDGQGLWNENTKNRDSRYKGQSSQRDKLAVQELQSTNFEDPRGRIAGQGPQIENRQTEQGFGTQNVAFSSRNIQGQRLQEDQTTQEGYNNTNIGFQDLGVGNKITLENQSAKQILGTGNVGYSDLGKEREGPQERHGQPTRPVDSTAYQDAPQVPIDKTDRHGLDISNAKYPGEGKGGRYNREQLPAYHGFGSSFSQQPGVRTKVPQGSGDKTLSQEYESENTGNQDKSLARDSQQGTLLGKGFGRSDLKYPVEDVWAKVPHDLYNQMSYSDFTDPFVRAPKYSHGSVIREYHRPKDSNSHFVKYGNDGSGYNEWGNIMFSHLTNYDPFSLYGLVGSEPGHGRKYTSFDNGYQLKYGDGKRIWSRNYRLMELYRMCQELSFLFRQGLCVPTMTFLLQCFY